MCSKRKVQSWRISGLRRNANGGLGMDFNIEPCRAGGTESRSDGDCVQLGGQAECWIDQLRRQDGEAHYSDRRVRVFVRGERGFREHQA